ASSRSGEQVAARARRAIRLRPILTGAAAIELSAPLQHRSKFRRRPLIALCRHPQRATAMARAVVNDNAGQMTHAHPAVPTDLEASGSIGLPSTGPSAFAELGLAAPPLTT